MKMIKEGVFFLILILIFPLSSGFIVITSQPKAVYNFGDTLNVNFSIEKLNDYSGFVDVFLSCDSNNSLLYRLPANLKANKVSNFSFDWFIDAGSGNCNIAVVLSNEQQNTLNFSLTHELLVSYSLNHIVFFPSERLILNGSAMKQGSFLDRGYALFSIGGITNQTSMVRNGSFSFSFDIPSNARSGDYEFELNVFEGDSLRPVTNQRISRGSFNVKQKPSFIEIFGPESVRPPANISLSAILMDQAKTALNNESVILKIYDPSGSRVVEQTLGSGSALNYNFSQNAQRGAWNMVSYYGSVSSTKQLFVTDNRAVRVDLIDNSDKPYFMIVNTGNVPYEGLVEFSFSNESSEFKMPINVSVDVGGTFSYYANLTGNYSVAAEGSKIGNVILTGAVVGSGESNRSIIWVFVFISFIAVSFIAVRLRVSRIKPGGGFSRMQGQKVQSQMLQTDRRRVAVMFLHAPNSAREFERVFSDRRMVFRSLDEHTGFSVVSSSKFEEPEKFLFEMAESLGRTARNIGQKISLVLHSETVNTNELRYLLTNTKKLLSNQQDGMLVTASVYEKLGKNEQNLFKLHKGVFLGESLIKTYLLS